MKGNIVVQGEPLPGVGSLAMVSLLVLGDSSRSSKL